MPGDKCFVDTNIWLYAFVQSDEADKTALAGKLVSGHEIAISVQVVNELCVNLIRKAGFPESRIAELVSALYERHEVVGFSRELLLSASELRVGHSFSYWDSLIVSAAISSGASILYSEDMCDGMVVHNHLRIVNPFR
ncbi:MAG: PIN domain-containing protein [Nitrospirae bacterium]|nr:PIN domain-containing protein [Nitrospirota bacterium]